MNALFNFDRPRSAGGALIFYIVNLLIVMAGGAIAGFMTAQYAQAGSETTIASAAGELFAVVYSGIICVRIITQRKLAPVCYGLAVLVLPVAWLSGGIGGLIIPAILTTRGAKEQNEEQAGEQDKAAEAYTIAPQPSVMGSTAARSTFGRRQ